MASYVFERAILTVARVFFPGSTRSSLNLKILFSEKAKGSEIVVLTGILGLQKIGIRRSYILGAFLLRNYFLLDVDYDDKLIAVAGVPRIP